MHSLVFKVTPVEYGHVFLVPCTTNRLYQFLDPRSVELVTRVAAEINNCSFRVFYDCCRPNRSNVYFQVINHSWLFSFALFHVIVELTNVFVVLASKFVNYIQQCHYNQHFCGRAVLRKNWGLVWKPNFGFEFEFQIFPFRISKNPSFEEGGNFNWAKFD